jgi:LAS superfamily LD-carboxypeptidase LdcB
MKRLIVTALAVGLLTLGTAGVASAQTTGGSSTSPSTQAPNPNTKHGARTGVAVGVLRVSAKTIGVKPRDLATALCGGQTLEAVASQHGKSAPDLVTALVKAADQRIDKAQQSGKVDAAKASTLKASAQARVTKLVSSYHPSAKRCQALQGNGASGTTGSTTAPNGV